MRGVIAFLVIFSATNAAQGASFDCARAATDAEKAICGDPKLGRLDQQIKDTYNKAYWSLEDRFRVQFRSVQRQWLRERDASHDLQASMQARLTRLQQPMLVSVDSLTFIQLDGDSRPAYLLSQLPGTKAYNEWASEAFNKTLTYISDEEQAVRCRGKNDAIECPDASTESIFTIDYASPELLSISENDIYNGWHTAHPANSDERYHWWLSKRGSVDVAEIFSGPSYKTTIQAALNKQLNSDTCVGDCATPAFDPQNWVLTPFSLVVVGQYYDFNAGRGHISFEIPWANFKDGVRDSFLTKLQKKPSAK